MFLLKATPPAGIEPASPKGPVLKTGAIPLCDGGLFTFIKINCIF